MAVPRDVIDEVLIRWPSSIDSLLPPHHLANPISLGIHFVHYLLLAPLFSSTTGPESVLRSGRERVGVSSRWDHLENDGRIQGRGLGGSFTVGLVQSKSETR